jgi:hypothetical protein
MTTSTEVEGLFVGPEPPTVAANEEFTGPWALRAGPTNQPWVATGWDPYEVWRTRIKAAQDELETGPGNL